MRLLPLLLALSALSAPALAQNAHETFYYDGIPSEQLVALWSSFPGPRSYVIHAGSVYATELRALSRLRGADRVQVEVDQYPTEDALPEWRKLAGQGVEFVLLGQAGLPTEDEIQRLNGAGFARCLFVIGYLPGPEESARLEALRCRLSLTFAVRAYPKFADKEGLAAIPSRVPMLYSTDYWPSYTHMDTLNMLPHRKRLRVADTLPSDDSLPYLKNIRLLDDVQLSTRFDVSGADWAKLDGLALTWASVGHVPSSEALAGFEKHASGSRRLVIDSDQTWTTEERTRLERSPLSVEWIHAAPMSFTPRAQGTRWR
jgi:hypothetical protein